MDAHHYRPHRQTGRVSDALDRLAELSDIDDRIRGHVFGLAEYHESEAASAYPLFDLADIADLTHSICADDPKLADALAYIAEAESPSIACMMAAIKDRINRFTDASVAR